MSKLVNAPDMCPFCGQCGLTYSDHFFYNDNIIFPWECECGAKGREVYYLDFLHHENCVKDGKFIAYTNEEEE